LKTPTRTPKKRNDFLSGKFSLVTARDEEDDLIEEELNSETASQSAAQNRHQKVFNRWALQFCGGGFAFVLGGA